MRRIAHLSDLHFGRHDPRVVAALGDALGAEQPDLVVISGDFTQRARNAQFIAARHFIERLREIGLPLLMVPGNHDVPLYDVTRRFLAPLRRFRRHIERDPMPFVADAEMAVLGINTARSAAISGGRVSEEQMAAMRQRFAGVAPGARKVLVTHHPLVELPWGEDGRTLKAAGRAERALKAAVEAGVHLLLAGHHHRPFSGSAAAFLAEAGAMLVVQAGTTTSTRLREEANSFNLLTTEGPRLEVGVRAWDGTRFVAGEPRAFHCHDGHWAEG